MPYVTIRILIDGVDGDWEEICEDIEIPESAYRRLKNGSVGIGEVIIGDDPYVLHRLDLSGEEPVIEVVPRLQ